MSAPQRAASCAPSPSMMNIAPRRSKGFSWLARWNIHADSASLPMFFCAPRISSRVPPTET